MVYGERRGEGATFLPYTSAPFATAVEITGLPVVWLRGASTHVDGAFFAYLEDVAPDGRVVYVTEGVLRGRHRRVSSAPPGR